MDNLVDLTVREDALNAFASTLGDDGFDLKNEFDAFMQPDLTQLTPLIKSDYTPQQLDQLLTRGIDLHTRGRVKEAMELYHEVLLHDPKNKKCLYFTAIALSQQKQPEDQVMALMEHACEGMSNVPEAQYNLGILYHRMGRPLDAIPRFEVAIKRRPGLVEAKTSLGGCYLNKGELELGKHWLTQAAKTDANDINSVYSRAFARLTIGNLLDGFNDYDIRWKNSSFLIENRRDFGKAHFWNGKPMKDKVLYVHTEQGAGDIIMFSRFLPEIRRRSQARRLIVEVGATLVEHLKQIEGVDDVIASNTPSPELPHFYLPFLTMMRRCGIYKTDRIYGQAGFLDAVESVDTSLVKRESPRLRVGISWAGSKNHTNDRYRSIPWRAFYEHLVSDVRFKDRVTWYSLQVGDRARDVDENPGRVDIVDLTPAITTFGQTARMSQELDLMICVDTATVHCSATLRDGPDILMFVPAAPDWRWLLEREDSPWYARVILLRQQRYDDWASPLQQAAHWLEMRLGDKQYA